MQLFDLGFSYRLDLYEKWIDEEARILGKLLDFREAHNLVTTVGVNVLLNATFVGGLASPAWYLGMVKGSGAPTFNIADTMASHAGWTEVLPTTDVVQTLRQVWTPNGAPSGGIVSNSSAAASYTIATGASPTLQGLFMADQNTIGGTSGNLYGETTFSGGSIVTAAGNVVNITATLTITAG